MSYQIQEKKTTPEYGIQDLFPCPLIKMDVDHYVAESVFKNSVLREAGSDDTINKNGIINFFNTQNVFTLYSELQPLHDDILSKANYIYQKILNYDSELKITNAWFNICAVGGHQLFHNHCNSVISGTLYIHADKYTEIQFQSPYASVPSMHNQIRDLPSDKPNEKGYEYHNDYHRVNVSAGQCLFWPSFLLHGYQENRTNSRLSLSFNLFPTQVNRMYKL
mgnify:FL=1